MWSKITLTMLQCSQYTLKVDGSVGKCTAQYKTVFLFHPFTFSYHSHRMAQRLYLCIYLYILWHYHHHDSAIWIILLWWCTVKPIVLFTHRRRWCFHMEQVAYIHFHCIWWGSCGCLLWMLYSPIGNWFQLVAPIQSFPSDSSYMLGFICHTV